MGQGVFILICSTWMCRTIRFLASTVSHWRHLTKTLLAQNHGVSVLHLYSFLGAPGLQGSGAMKSCITFSSSSTGPWTYWSLFILQQTELMMLLSRKCVDICQTSCTTEFLTSL